MFIFGVPAPVRYDSFFLRMFLKAMFFVCVVLCFICSIQFAKKHQETRNSMAAILPRSKFWKTVTWLPIRMTLMRQSDILLNKIIFCNFSTGYQTLWSCIWWGLCDTCVLVRKGNVLSQLWSFDFFSLCIVIINAKRKIKENGMKNPWCQIYSTKT